MTDLVDRLRCLGVSGILLIAAEQGLLTDLSCAMPECLCPEELGKRTFFEPAGPDLPDWMPTVDHATPKSEGGTKTLENARLAHRLCNRVDYSIRVGRSWGRDQSRVDKARDPAEVVRLTNKRDVGEMLCGPEHSHLRALLTELQAWDGVSVEPYFDRGHGPTGFGMLRNGQRFANAFLSKSLQFAHGGEPLLGLGSDSEGDVGPDYQTIPSAELPERLDEARLLASYAYWRVGMH
jgi:hypothetical protein